MAAATTTGGEENEKGTVTKIVRNYTQPPILGAKPMVATTLMHARPYGTDGRSWLVVSRAIGGSHFPLDKAGGTSEMLLGVNLLEALGPTTTQMTAVTHVYSPSIPLMVAQRLGVQSAVQFVQDLRGWASSSSAATTNHRRDDE